MSADLLIFAKEPVPGRVKTRLAPVLGDEGAARLYAAFVGDLCERLGAEGRFQVTLVADPGPEAPFFRDLAAKRALPVTGQGTGDLGARMAGALRRHLEAGAEATLLIGTDLPDLPTPHLDAALEALGRAPLVFGPTLDGGYYLVGAHRSALPAWDRIEARLFSGIPWGRETVLRETLKRAGDIEVALGPAWYDVDDPADLERLVRHLESGREPTLPRTRAALAEAGVP